MLFLMCLVAIDFVYFEYLRGIWLSVLVGLLLQIEFVAFILLTCGLLLVGAGVDLLYVVCGCVMSGFLLICIYFEVLCFYFVLVCICVCMFVLLIDLLKPGQLCRVYCSVILLGCLKCWF